MDELSPRNLEAQELVAQIKLGEEARLTLDELKPLVQQLLMIEHAYRHEVQLYNARKTMGIILKENDDRFQDLPSNLTQLESQLISTGAYYAIQNQ